MKVITMIFLLITVLQIYVLSNKLNMIKIKKLTTIIAFIFLIVSIILELYLLKLIDTEVNNNLKFKVRVILYMLIVLIYNVYIYIECKKQKIIRTSIKEAIDKSQTGIMLLDKNSEINMINSRMKEILDELEIKNNFIKAIKNKAIDKVGQDYILKSKNKIYIFTKIENSGEVLVNDITEEYNLQKEIEKQNKKIENNNKEITETIEIVEKIEKEKELQRLKRAFHDMLGYKLSIIHQYLIQENNTLISFEEIKRMVEDIFIDINEANNPYKNLSQMIEIYKKLGVTIEIEGTLPKNEKRATYFFEIIRECITNAIKHANSSKIEIAIKNECSKDVMKITNDGNLPKENIIENDGIKGIRRRVAEMGGKIKISTSNKFMIEIEV